MASALCVNAYHQAGILHSQGQTQEAGADVPLQQVNQGLEKPGEPMDARVLLLTFSEVVCPLRDRQQQILQSTGKPHLILTSAVID